MPCLRSCRFDPPIRFRSLGAGLAALAVLLAFGAAPALGRTVYVAALTGDTEVPGPGDPAGEGFAQLSIDVGAGQLCWDLLVDLGEAAVAAHVHDGDAGTAGPVVVTLGTPDENGESVDCLDGVDPSLLQSIVDDPAGFYVNVHTDTYPDGAIRGQLDGLEIVTLSVGKLACPAGVDGPEDLGGPGDPSVRPSGRARSTLLPTATCGTRSPWASTGRSKSSSPTTTSSRRLMHRGRAGGPATRPR